MEDHLFGIDFLDSMKIIFEWISVPFMVVWKNIAPSWPIIGTFLIIIFAVLLFIRWLNH